MNNTINFLLVADWITASFPIIRIIIMALIVIFAILLIIAVLIQPSNSEGMGALTGQSTDTFYSKNKGRSIEGIMKRLTIICGIGIAVLSILFFITLVIYPVGL